MQIGIKSGPIKNIEPGHIAVYGQTMTGKTRFAKAIIENMLMPTYCYVFLGSVSNDWGPPNTNYPYIVKKDWGDIEDVMRDCLRYKGEKTQEGLEKNVIIVFDDFNGHLNGNSDAIYKNLFTQGRHMNIRVINMSQDVSGIAKTGRANIRYAVATFSNNLQMIKSLSDNFLSDVPKMSNHMKTIKGTKNVLVIDTKNGEIIIDNALNYEVTGADKNGNNHGGALGLNVNGEVVGNQLEYGGLLKQHLPGNNTGNNQYGNHPGNNHLGMINTELNTGNRNILNNGTYNDNSIINLQNNQEIQHQMNVNQWNNEKLKINYAHQRKMKLMGERDELYDLLCKSSYPNETKLRIIELLKIQCHFMNINMLNWRHYGKLFMEHYFPNVKWGCSSKVSQLITDHSEVITDPNASNITNFLYTTISSVIRDNRDDQGLLGNIINRTPVRYLTNW